MEPTGRIELPQMDYKTIVMPLDQVDVAGDTGIEPAGNGFGVRRHAL